MAFDLTKISGRPDIGLSNLYFCSGFQSVDEEDYGGVWELTKEGFMTSMASFLVIWIIVYTGLHFE